MVDSGRNKITILVVDDEECLLNLIRIILEQEGYSLLCARSAEEALQIMQSQEQSIDLLLTDMRMPSMTGGVLAGEFKTVYPASEVIYMTAYSPEDTTLRLPGQAVLFKPFSPVLLCEMVEKSLDRLSQHNIDV
ncbi:response regulator [Verrucomicrobia bacterium S94]|nr:response regulator [Verrucomicrobia bacterium S94]